MNNPLVSIVVPCYNQAQFLDEALQSVLDQTYSNWECVIVNDGSPDNTKEVVEKWILKDNRFIYLFQENTGVCAARNFGIMYASGEFILPLDSDDKISPDYVLLALQSFHNDDLLKVVYCKAEKFGEEKGIWYLKPFSLMNLARFNMIFCAALFRKKDWERVGGFDVNMVSGLEDWEFWIAILKDGGNVKCLDIYGFYYRIKKISRNKQYNDEDEKKILEYMSVKHAAFYVKQLGSFTHLCHILDETENNHFRKLKSEKFVIDVFCTTFFGFSIFGLYKNKTH
jgi:glycosyltransferase involved in cell wall biosynthesis